MKSKIVATLIVGSALSVSAGASAAAKLELLLSGPVEDVNVARNTIAVLGHRIETKDAYRVVRGQRVNVYGVLMRDGTITSAVVESSSQYVPGADRVYIKGVVTYANSTLGLVNVGDTRIDYTGLLYSSSFSAPSVGETVELSGTQPARQGVVLASGRGARAAIMNGGGARAAIMNGGGVESQIMNGGGVESEIMNGGGVESEIMNGGGVESEIMNGGGEAVE